MNNEFVLLHDANNEKAPVWVNMSLVLRIEKYMSGSMLQLVGDNNYFYSDERPTEIIDVLKGL